MLDLNITILYLIYCVNIKYVFLIPVYHHKSTYTTVNTLTVSAHVNITKTGLIGNSFIKQIQTHVHVQDIFLQYVLLYL